MSIKSERNLFIGAYQGNLNIIIKEISKGTNYYALNDYVF